MPELFKTIEEDGEYAIGKSRPRKNASKLHKKALAIIRREFPNTVVIQEAAIKVTSNSKAKSFLDLYLPSHRLAIECHGKQHDHYTPHYHGPDKLNFIKAQHRDRQKKEWCELNSIRMLELFYNESEKEWTNKLQAAILGYH